MAVKALTGDLGAAFSRRTARQRRERYQRLCSAMRDDRKVLEPYRKNFNKAMRAYAGAHWSERAADKEQPLNMLDMFVRAWTRGLVPKNPRWHLSTWTQKAEKQVKQAEQWANDEAETQRLDRVYRRCVFNALFGLGILKVDLATPEEASLTGFKQRAGVPFIKNVGFQDWVGDMHAHCFEEMAYEGHRFRVPLAAVVDSRRYKEEGRRNLLASLDMRYEEDGDEKTSHIGRNDYDFTEEFEEMVDLWWVFTRRDRRQIVMAAPHGGVPGGEDGAVVLLDKEWFGPPAGPFYYLELGMAPDSNPLPKAPGMDLVFPNEVINNLGRKLIGQAGRQKTLTVGRAGQDADADTVRKANDGDVVLVQDPEAVKELRTGGPDAANFQLFDYLTTKFDMQAGNLSTLLGLQAMAKTAKQEGLLDENSSRTMQDLQETTLSFISDSGGAWLWWWWHHPKMVMRTQREVPGFPQYTRTRHLFPNDRGLRENPGFRGQMRTAKWGRDFRVKVDPYSMQFTTPQAKANRLTGHMMQMILPVIGALKQQGMEPDWDYFFETLARYEDFPELKRLLQTAELPPEGVGGAAEGAGAGGPKVGGPREYVRKSEGQGGEAGPDHAAAMAAAQNNNGGQPQ